MKRFRAAASDNKINVSHVSYTLNNDILVANIVYRKKILHWKSQDGQIKVAAAVVVT